MFKGILIEKHDPKNLSWTAFKMRSAWCQARLNEEQ